MYTYIHSLNEVFPPVLTATSPTAIDYLSKNLNTRHEKPPFELVVSGIQETPKQYRLCYFS